MNRIKNPYTRIEIASTNMLKIVFRLAKNKCHMVYIKYEIIYHLHCRNTVGVVQVIHAL